MHLAIPSHRVSGVNLSMRERGLDTRYLAEVASFRDENTGASEKPVQLARKNFRLLVEGEPKGGCVTMPVARVERISGDTFQLDPKFAPPLLDFYANEFIVSIARRLVEILSAKSGILAGMRRQKNQSLAEFTTADIANFWLLYTINLHFPHLRHLFETKHGHPEELFSMMLALASTLTTFSLQIQPRDLPVYDHDDLGECFAELDEKLRHLLETVIPSNFVSLPLKLIRPSIYAASIFEDRFLENTRMYLAIQADMNEGRADSESSAIDQSLFGQPHRTSDPPGAAGSSVDPRDVAAHHHSDQAESPVFQPESIGPGVGSDRPRAQHRRVHSRRFRECAGRN